MEKYVEQSFPKNKVDDAVIESLRQLLLNIPIECGIRKFIDQQRSIIYEVVFPDDFLHNIDPKKVKRKIEVLLFFDAPDTKIRLEKKSALAYNYCFCILDGYDSFHKLTKQSRHFCNYYNNQGFGRGQRADRQTYSRNTEPNIEDIDIWFRWAILNLTQKERKRKFANYYHPDKVNGNGHIFKIYWSKL